MNKKVAIYKLKLFYGLFTFLSYEIYFSDKGKQKKKLKTFLDLNESF